MPTLNCRRLACVPYSEAWRAMQAFTDNRHPESDDECWLLEHPPVYTLGQAGRREHIHNTTGIPVVESDRGGQVTYHGPGQLVLYTLFDLRRLGIGVRNLVIRLENTVIQLLQQQGIHAAGRRDAPGVYVDKAKLPRSVYVCARGVVTTGCHLTQTWTSPRLPVSIPVVTLACALPNCVTWVSTPHWMTSVGNSSTA